MVQPSCNLRSAVSNPRQDSVTIMPESIYISGSSYSASRKVKIQGANLGYASIIFLNAYSDYSDNTAMTCGPPSLEETIDEIGGTRVSAFC